MAEREITEAELAELVRRTEVATSAFMRGDMDRYLELTTHASGYTLANPLGGMPERYDDRAPSVREAADWFKAAPPHRPAPGGRPRPRLIAGPVG